VTDTIVIDSNLNPQSKESQSPKKRGRKKGATSYTKGDLTALLDSVEEILLIPEDKWESVSQHFNETYALKFSQNTRTSVAHMVHQLVVADVMNMNNKPKILLVSLTKKLELLVQKLLFCHLKKQIVLFIKRKRNH
jgi:hypothetical protein